MEDSEYGYLAAPEGLGPPAAMDPTRTEQQHQDPLLQLQQGRADSEEKPLLRKGSLRSALVRDGKYSRRQASSRVRFAEPLVESYFSVPCCDKTPRMVSIVSGEDGGAPWGDILREGSETDIELEVSMSGRYINNPVYGGQSIFLVTGEGARSASAVERGYYGCNYHWGMAGSNANPLHQELETELLCGVGLAWMLFGFGFLLFPLWYFGMFSTCITRDKRDTMGAVGCGVAAVVVTAMLILVLIDAQGRVQPFLDPKFRLL